MRIAFTILLNGMEHLMHNNYYAKMIEMFDFWVIVEGVAKNNGSTSWCKLLPDTFHNDFLSNDGTTEFIDVLSRQHSKVIVVRSGNGYWDSKDDQVNAAIKQIRQITNSCYLWEVDIDEQWTEEQLDQAEKELMNNNGKTGCFYCKCYVGENQVAMGDWGEGKTEPYRRLWYWEGEDFLTHEPPKLNGNNNPRLLLTPRFNHYSYFFEKDIRFKEAYYTGYQGLYGRWVQIQSNKDTLPVRALLGNNVWWSNTNTIIQYVK